MTPEQFAEIKAWLAWEYRCSAGVKLEAIVEDLVAEVERLQGELAKTQRACQTLGKVVDRQAVDICRISGVPMPESGDADFERAWSVAFEMADEIKRLRAQVAAVEALHVRHGSSTDEYGWCSEDDFTWPCQTVRTLAPGEQVQS